MRPHDSRREARATRALWVVAAAALSAGLTGCAGGAPAEPEVTASPSTPATAAPNKPAAPEAAPLVIPGCGDLLVVSDIDAETGQTWEAAVPIGPDNYHVHRHAMGPQALAALDAASQSEYCVWVQEGTFGEVWVEGLVVELDAETQDAFVAGLRASDYVESAAGETALFSYRLETKAAPIEIRYAFSGSVWVISLSTLSGALPELVRDLILAGLEVPPAR